jgi:hypothetical protein
MLHKDVLMSDIDVDQWRNSQSLLLRSAKAARRLVVIHDKGRVVKFRHTSNAAVKGRVEAVEDAHELAELLYELNKDMVDFVMVMERDAVDSYFAQIQNAWDIDADLDEFVQATYQALDSYPDDIVTYPGTARNTLGMQWTTGASLAEVNEAARAHITPDTSVILAAHAEGDVWASLILDFDHEWKITSITTADPSLVDLHGSRDETLGRLVAWVESQEKEVSLAAMLDHDAAIDLLAAPISDKAALLRQLLSDSRASIGRAPEALLAG